MAEGRGGHLWLRGGPRSLLPRSLTQHPGRLCATPMPGRRLRTGAGLRVLGSAILRCAGRGCGHNSTHPAAAAAEPRGETRAGRSLSGPQSCRAGAGHCCAGPRPSFRAATCLPSGLPPRGAAVPGRPGSFLLPRLPSPRRDTQALQAAVPSHQTLTSVWPPWLAASRRMGCGSPCCSRPQIPSVAGGGPGVQEACLGHRLYPTHSDPLQWGPGGRRGREANRCAPGSHSCLEAKPIGGSSPAPCGRSRSFFRVLALVSTRGLTV